MNGSFVIKTEQIIHLKNILINIVLKKGLFNNDFIRFSVYN